MTAAGVPAAEENERGLLLHYVGVDDRGVELHVIAVPDDRRPDGLAVIHAMPTSFIRSGADASNSFADSDEAIEEGPS